MHISTLAKSRETSATRQRHPQRRTAAVHTMRQRRPTRDAHAAQNLYLHKDVSIDVSSRKTSPDQYRDCSSACGNAISPSIFAFAIKWRSWKHCSHAGSASATSQAMPGTAECSSHRVHAPRSSTLIASRGGRGVNFHWITKSSQRAADARCVTPRGLSS